MAHNRKTTPRLARLASKVLRARSSAKKAKELAGSVLSQRAPKKRK